MKDKNKNNFTEFFREKRQSQNISLEKLSELTKIQMYQLEAIEDGYFEKLPPSIYREGIFRRISKFLDIDYAEFIEAYKRCAETIDNSASSRQIDTNFSFQIGNTPIKKMHSYFVVTPAKLIFLSGALFLILLSSYIWYQFNFLVGPPNLVIDPGKDMITKEKSIVINGKTDTGVNLTINGESMYVASNGSFTKEVQLADGINVIEVEVMNSFGKITRIIRQVFKEIQ